MREEGGVRTKKEEGMKEGGGNIEGGQGEKG